MKIQILTIFPEIFSGFLNTSLIEKALAKGSLEISIISPRDHAEPPHFKVDDVPYGGGAGMVMKPEPLVAAIEAAKKSLPRARTVLLSPAGRPFQQAKAEELASLPELILVCGRYEGIDQRVIDLMIDEEISIGDYVLMGGEVPAMVVIESTVRLVSEVIGNQDSLEQESFATRGDHAGMLEAPHYTRPPTFRGLSVPEVLTSGDHKKIAEWRKVHSLELTRQRRPDLIKDKH